MSIARSIAWCAALIFVLAPAAFAQSSPPENAVIEVTTSASVSDSEAIEFVIRELLDRLHLEVRFTRAASIDLDDVFGAHPGVRPPFARVWIDLNAPRGATVFVVDPASDRVLMREVPREPGGEEIAREAVGHILETASEGILEGAPIGLTRAVAAHQLADQIIRPSSSPSPSPSPSPVHSSNPGWRASANASIFYEIRGFSGTIPVVHTVGADFFAGFAKGSVRIGALLSAGYVLHTVADTPRIGIALDTASLRLSAIVANRVARRLILAAGLGAGVDIVRIEPHYEFDQTIWLAPTAVRVVGMLRAALTVRVPLTNSIAAFASLQCDVQIVPVHYVFMQDDSRVVVLDPWIAQPSIAIGFTVP